MSGPALQARDVRSPIGWLLAATAVAAFATTLPWLLTTGPQNSQADSEPLALALVLALALGGLHVHRHGIGQGGRWARHTGATAASPWSSALASAALPTALLGLAWVQPHAPRILTAAALMALAWCSLRQLTPRGERLPFGVLVLTWLALPVVTHLDFYLGAPLRHLVGSGAVALLNAGGLQAARVGQVLTVEGQAVLIDAPCSGVQMLWSGAALTAASHLLLGVRAWRAVLGWALSLGLLLGANAVRMAVLALLAARPLAVPLVPAASAEASGHQHELVGVAIFGGAAVMLLLLNQALSPNPRPPGQTKMQPQVRGARHSSRPTPARAKLTRPAQLAMAGLVLLCAASLISLVLRPVPGTEAKAAALRTLGEALAQAQGSDAGPADAALAGFAPKSLGGEALLPTRVSGDERSILAARGIALARHRVGDAAFVLRVTAEPTRHLHSAARCLRGAGFKLGPRELREDAEGRRWATRIAGRAGARQRVSERIVDAEGREFLDLSDWWWAAATGRSRGPWAAWTLVEPVPLKAPADPSQ